MRKLMIAFVMGAASLLPLDGYSLGLGEIEVHSALNQELDAEIQLLSAVPEDAETLIVKLASREEFVRAGLDRPFLLQSLKFSNVVKDGVPYIKVTTSKPVREPFLNFLIELDWPKGHLLREYTILLDPPVFINEESASRPAVTGSRPGAAPVAAPSSSRPAVRAVTPGSNMAPVSPDSSAAPRQAPDAADASSAETPQPAASRASAPAFAYTEPRQNADYRIRQGDTAWSLADTLRPDQSVSIEQMMLALLRTNPESFINGNVNGLKRGFILRVPDRNEITSLSQAEAVAIVGQQNALWREYRQLAAGSGTASALAKSGNDKSAAGSTKSAGDARLSIVSAGKGAATGAAGNIDDMSADELREQLALAEERLESERLEKENLKGDVSDLELQVSKMKRLLSIEDEGLAKMQAATTGKTKVAEPAAKVAPITADKPVTEIKAADKLPPVSDPKLDPATSMTAVDEDLAEVAQTDQPFADLDELKPDPDSEVAAELQDSNTQQQQAVDSMELEPQRPQGMLEKLLADPLVLAAAGGALLVVMMLVYLIVKRRRSSAASAMADPADFMDDDLASVADMLDDHAIGESASDEEVRASMAAAEDAADAFDSDATMILPSAGDTVITKADSQEEARDDIIAEADVYLAYGIYQQAEELLKNAINEHPDNDAYRMKLAETYFAGKNVTGFGELATVMHKRTKGTGSRWQKLAAMGKDLIPGHELFKGAGAGTIALDDLVPSPEPTMDFDLGLDDAGTKQDTALDFSLDDTASLDLEDDSKASTADELEFDLTDADALEDEPAAAEEEFSLDIEASELDISTDDAKSRADTGLDFDLDLSAEAAEGLDFDMDADAELKDTSAAKKPAARAASADADMDLADLDDVDEVSTKLDLARAYLDMGDREGTRSILEEVVEEGNAEQKAEAEALLAELKG